MPLYHLYESQRAALAPARWFADRMRAYADHPMRLGSRTVTAMLAAADVFADAHIRHVRPDFGIRHIARDGGRVAVREEVVDRFPFGDLTHFVKEDGSTGPTLLIVAPMSGHFATLLRGTVEAFLPDHNVFITDWVNARDVSLRHGAFGFDDYVAAVMRFLRHLGGEVHVLAVCQPAVPVLAAAALLEADGADYAPKSLTLMGGPIDVGANPTDVNRYADKHGVEDLRRRVIARVPAPHAGAGRKVYPGFLQLAGFMAMNLGRHVQAHVDMFKRLVKGDGEGNQATKDFYNEYLTVADLPAEFFLGTVERVFHQRALATGKLVVDGRKVELAALTRTALMTVEGEQDDICAPGQTFAAHGLCTNIRADRRRHWLQPKVGHYGVFNGRRFREEIQPRIADHIRSA